MREIGKPDEALERKPKKIELDVEVRFRDYFCYVTTIVRGRHISNVVKHSLGRQILESASEVYLSIKRANRTRNIGEKIKLANKADSLWDDTKALMRLFVETERQHIGVRKEGNLVEVAEGKFGQCLGGWLRHIRGLGTSPQRY